MPSKSKKQLNFFKLVKSYVDNGPEGVMNMWGTLFPKKKMPTSSELDKIINVADKINYSDLEDMVSGISGIDKDFGAQNDFKVGYWMKFDAWYSDYQGQKHKNTFIAKITRVRPEIKLVNFNSEDIYNKNGIKISPIKRTKITSADYMWLDFVYFEQIQETAKDKKELIMKNEIRKIIRQTLIESLVGLTIKDKNGENKSVKTGMLVQSVTDETSKGQIKNVGINFDVIPNKNNLNIYWYHGDKAGTMQKVDLNDVIAI